MRSIDKRFSGLAIAKLRDFWRTAICAVGILAAASSAASALSDCSSFNHTDTGEVNISGVLDAGDRVTISTSGGGTWSFRDNTTHDVLYLTTPGGVVNYTVPNDRGGHLFQLCPQAGMPTASYPNITYSCTPAPLPQTLTITAPSTKLVSDAAFDVSATSSVPSLTASVSLSAGPSNVCTYANGKVTPVAAGTCTVTANQAGNSTYASASQTKDITISLVPQTLTITAPSTKLMTDAPFDVSATSSVPSLTSGISIIAAPGLVCRYANGKVTPVAAGTCRVTASSPGNSTYAAASQTQDITISRVQSTITFNAPSSKLVTDPDFTVSASTTASGLTVSFLASGACSNSNGGGTIHITGSGTCTITASQAGNGTYAPATDVVRTIAVSTATQTLTITAPDAKLVNDAPFDVSATSSVSSLSSSIHLSASPSNVCSYANGKITPAGAGTCTLTATQAGNGQYGSATQTKTIAIGKTRPTLTISAPDKAYLTDGAFEISVQSSGAPDVTLAAAPSTVCSYAAGKITPIAVGDCVVTASTPGNSAYTAASNAKTIVITKKSNMATTIIAKQSAARVQAIMTNQMGSSRQIDRLMDQGGSINSLTPGPAFTAREQRALDVATGAATAPRLGMGTGLASSLGGTPLGAQLGLRATTDDDLASPMRTRGPGGSDTARGGGMNIAGLALFGTSDGAAAYNFSTSLRDITRAAQQQEEQRLKDDPTAAAMGFTGARSGRLDKRANPLDVWVEGRFMRLNDGRNGADLSGYSGLFGTGVDYVFNRALLAGVSLSYDVSGQKSSAQGTEARGTGWLVGPYATVRLSDNLFWQSRAAWGKAHNEVSPDATTTDSFGSTRWLASSKLTGRYQMSAWQLRPSVGVAYMEETSDGYTSANGSLVDSVKRRVGTASAGPEISYQYRLNPDVLIEPRAGIEAIWTFARDISVGGNSAIVGGDAIGPEGMRGRAELGLRAMIVGGTVIDLSGAYDGIGAGDYNTITGRAVLRMPLN